MVSIVIPVYNCEKYITRCLKSVKEQTYKELEIILVDDGSTDQSATICDNFAQEDSRVKVIHKSNEGLSSARNIGIDEASGDIITFLDSDDYIELDYIENSRKILEETNADIVIQKMTFIQEKENEHNSYVNSFSETIELSTEKAIEISLYQTLFSCCIPGKMYRKNIFNSIRFPIGKLSEDLAICHKLFQKANRIEYCNKIGYYYRQHEKSIMHSFNEKRLDAIQWCKEIEQYCIDNYPLIINAAKCRTFNVSVNLLIELPLNGEIREKCYEKLVLEIKRTRLNVILNNKARKKERVAAILSYFGEKTLKLVWKIIPHNH